MKCLDCGIPMSIERLEYLCEGCTAEMEEDYEALDKEYDAACEDDDYPEPVAMTRIGRAQ